MVDNHRGPIDFRDDPHLSELPLEQRLRLRGLSPRESEMTVLAARGWTGPEIAGRLGVMESTVKNVLAGARAKLGCERSRHLVLTLVDEGLARPEELFKPEHLPPR